MSIFNSKIPKNIISQTLNEKIKSDYRNILDRVLVRSINLKTLETEIRKVEQDRSIGDGFRAAVKEVRRSEKAKMASNKHTNKRKNDFASLEIDLRKATFERDQLIKELNNLNAEIAMYKRC